MRRKIEKLPLLALFLSMSAPVVAGVTVSFSVPEPSHADGESISCNALPVLDLAEPERLSVSIECLNTATNELEVWFCTDAEARREFRDLVVGLDGGNLFVSGRDVGSRMPDEVAIPHGRCAIDLELRSHLLLPTSLTVKSGVNGMRIPLLETGVGMTNPREWRSVRVVSRGLWGTSDLTGTISKGKVGSSVILR